MYSWREPEQVIAGWEGRMGRARMRPATDTEVRARARQAAMDASADCNHSASRGARGQADCEGARDCPGTARRAGLQERGPDYAVHGLRFRWVDQDRAEFVGRLHMPKNETSAHQGGAGSEGGSRHPLHC